jgi:hypothetical protein
LRGTKKISAMTAAVAAATAVASATAFGVEGAAAALMHGAATMIKLRVMALAAPMVFPRMMDDEDGIVPPSAAPTV